MLSIAKTSKRKVPLNPRPVLEHWWAVEALIASYNHVYQVTHNTRYEELGPIGISIYGDAPIASFQYELLALSPDTKSVIDAIRDYPFPSGAY
jgi:hypothetical protein